MDEKHLIAAVRYIEQNPVRVGLVKDPGEWPWSSASAHLRNKDDQLVIVRPCLELIPDWDEFLKGGLSSVEDFGTHERTGRPLGDPAFVDRCETATGRCLRPKKRGPKSPG
jgi:putative transposase